MPATTYPYGLTPLPRIIFVDDKAEPLAGGKIYTYIAGTDTPKTTYSDVIGTPASNPIILDDDGGATIYLGPGGYKFNLTDANDVQISGWPVDTIEDIGLTFTAQWGLNWSAGAKDVASGYTTLATDSLVTVDSTGGANPCIINLVAASQAVLPLTIKNHGTVPLAITPNGTDLIDLHNVAYTVPAASNPTYPSLLLISDGVSSWAIVSSHGVV